MSNDKKLGFDTLQIHGGAMPDATTGARQTPIYQTTSYVFESAEHAAALYSLKEIGYIYSRLTNPTVSVLQERLATLEGGIGAVCCATGHAAQLLALFALMDVGKNVVASNRLYGGTITQFSQTIKRFGWEAKFVDVEDLGALEAAIDENTRAVFTESIANPEGYLTDIPAIAEVAEQAGLPLIVDNTAATPYLCNPIAMGATLVVHSTTKFLTGNGTVTGGCVIDSGTFDWTKSGKFPSLADPEPAYHGLRFHDTFGKYAFTLHATAIGLRDLGLTMNPQAAHYTLLGIETLSLRMQRHVDNALAVAQWLEAHPAVERVSYAGLPTSHLAQRQAQLYPKGAGALFSFSLRAGFDACVKVVEGVELISHVANLGDAKTLIIHAASTTHAQLTPDQQSAAGAGANTLRISVGIEDVQDIIADLDQAIAKATGTTVRSNA